MSFIAMKCPSCGADIQFDDSRDYGFCNYCGTKVMQGKQFIDLSLQNTGSCICEKCKKACDSGYVATINVGDKSKRYTLCYECMSRLKSSVDKKNSTEETGQALADSDIKETFPPYNTQTQDTKNEVFTQQNPNLYKPIKKRKIKKLIIASIAVVVAISIFFGSFTLFGVKKDADGNKISKQDIAYINKAVFEVKKQWIKQWINKRTDSRYMIKPDSTSDIFNTRIIHIKENDTELFKDVEVVVEFDIFADYYGTAPYYFDVRNSVLFYKDGSCEVKNDILRYSIHMDLGESSKVIDGVTECGTSFNTGRIKHTKVNSENKKYVSDAIELVRDKYKNYNFFDSSSDGTLKITNTRLIFINDQSKNQYFENIEAIVEFKLQADIYGLAPYYINDESFNTVIFYKDGQTEVSSNYIKNIYMKTCSYITTYRDINAFSKILDFGSEFNCSMNLNSTRVTLLDKDMSDDYDKNH